MKEGAVTAMQRLADRAGIPVAALQYSPDAFPTTHPLALGPLGRNAFTSANKAAPKADVIIAIGNDGQYARFCEAAGLPELVTDERFRNNAARIAHRDELKRLIAPAMRTRTTAEWIALLEPLGVPCGPINRLDQVFADPQVAHRGLKVEVPHPVAGRLPLVANPIRYSRTPIRYETPPPLLGEHTGEVLRSVLGKSEAEIEALHAAGAI